MIYTYCGIVLVALNPYSELKSLYGADIMKVYRGHTGCLDPHVYAVSEQAFSSMTGFDFCIIFE